MVEIPGIRAFQFAMDLERIEAAFEASITAMEQSYRAAEEASDRYEASGEDDDEYDEEGALIHSTRSDLRWKVARQITDHEDSRDQRGGQDKCEDGHAVILLKRPVFGSRP